MPPKLLLTAGLLLATLKRHSLSLAACIESSLQSSNALLSDTDTHTAVHILAYPPPLPHAGQCCVGAHHSGCCSLPESLYAISCHHCCDDLTTAAVGATRLLQTNLGSQMMKPERRTQQQHVSHQDTSRLCAVLMGLVSQQHTIMICTALSV